MIYLGIIAGIFGLDYFIKRYVDKNRELMEETPILKGKVIIRKYYNKGAALNFLAKKPERMNADRLVGETAMVTEPIDACADTGAVKINGVLWTAKCTTGERVEAGGHVTIERVEGAKLYVRPAKCPCTKA